MEKTLIFNVLLKEGGEGYLAHCLELDLVTTAPTVEQVREEMVDLIACLVDCALTDNDSEYLYDPAPPEIWAEFFKCREALEETKRPVVSTSGRVPPWTWISVKTCKTFDLHPA